MTLLMVKEHLQAKRYHVREENGDLLAEKGRFSRWGPYVNHIGLIIFLNWRHAAICSRNVCR